MNRPLSSLVWLFHTFLWGTHERGVTVNGTPARLLCLVARHSWPGLQKLSLITGTNCGCEKSKADIGSTTHTNIHVPKYLPNLLMCSLFGNRMALLLIPKNVWMSCHVGCLSEGWKDNLDLDREDTNYTLYECTSWSSHYISVTSSTLKETCRDEYGGSLCWSILVVCLKIRLIISGSLALSKYSKKGVLILLSARLFQVSDCQ